MKTDLKHSPFVTKPSSLLFKLLLLALLAFILLLFLRRIEIPEDTADVFSLSGFTMGTTYQVQISKPPVDLNLPILGEQIQAHLQRLDRDVFSTYAENSELSLFNRTAVNETFIASLELLQVISSAQEIYHASNNSFDITVSPLVKLWGFGPTGNTELLPKPEDIEYAKSQLGSDAITVSLNQSTLIKSKAVQVDLSAIAKGYAVDQIAEHLQAQGVENFLVEIGGEIRVSGFKKPLEDDTEAEYWTLAIESPESGLSEVFSSFPTYGKSFAVAGSGDYRNYFEIDGQRYSHEINPLTGSPITHKLAAVTVISETATYADAYATALMVMGPEQGFAFASSNDLAAYFIIRTGSGFESRYTDRFEMFLEH